MVVGLRRDGSRPKVVVWCRESTVSSVLQVLQVSNWSDRRREEVR